MNIFCCNNIQTTEKYLFWNSLLGAKKLKEIEIQQKNWRYYPYIIGKKEV